ncbi:DNA-binding transcriptional regulator CytR [Silvimonas sp. JCM 19000]
MPDSSRPAPPQAVSIAAVARHAQVSVATVSRVLNGQQVVKPATRDAVMAAVQALGYRVNAMARNLRTAETRLLLVLVPDVGNPFYAEIMRGIDSVARQHGYLVVLCDTGADIAREHTWFDLLRRRRADGAICLDPDTVQHALANDNAGLAWVACAEFDPAMAVPYVGIDNRQAAQDAVLHLLQQGHRRIGLINSDAGWLYARQRKQGWLDALSGAGITPRPDWCIHTHSLDYAAGNTAMAQLLSLAEPPTAVFAVSDTLAIGALAGARSLGKRIPHDVAVVGFDDIALAAQTDPPLTTLAQPMRQLGETAVQLLLDMLADRSHRPASVLLPHRLAIRAST